MDEKKSTRATYLAQEEREINRAAREENISVEIETRAKHFYSIYHKMKRRGKGLDEISDLLGIRILCQDTVECYTVLGLVHKLWKPIDGRFKDYIAMPKANRYQSLHTTVMGEDGKLKEIQIRTHAMHQIAEYGIAAHWLYKRGAEIARPRAVAADLTIISKLRGWNDRRQWGAGFLEEIKSELLRDSIYIFTPKGDVIELPKGATAIDFAYHIHTEVGNRCRAAKADGHIVPLKRPLRNTQVVDIIVSQNAKPHLNWLRFAQTHRARSKIRHWLNKHDENVIIDRSIVVKKRGQGIRPSGVRPPQSRGIRGTAARRTGRKGFHVMDTSRVGVRIGKERNVMIRLARCCRPTTEDIIVGYVSRGRGITVHRAGCRSLAHIKDFSERRIEVEWETISPRAIRRFRMTARRVSDLFSEIEGAIKKYNGHLVAGKLSSEINGTMTGFFTIEIDRSEQFKRVLKNLRMIPAIINIQPCRNSSRNSGYGGEQPDDLAKFPQF